MINKTLSSEKTDELIWNKRLSSILVALLGFSFIAILAVDSYYDKPITQIFGYDVYDEAITHSVSSEIDEEHCQIPNYRIGQHCFSDFILPMDLVNEPNLWSKGYYSPTGFIPHVISNELKDLIGHRPTLFIYLTLLLFSLLTPALYVYKRNQSKSQSLLPFLLIGVTSVPVIFTLDRGNSVGFVVPWLLIFATRLRKNPDWIVTASIVASAAIRPQFALLAIGLIAFGQIKQFVYSVLGSIAINLLPFFIITSNPVSNIKLWLTGLTGYATDGRNGSDIPADQYPVVLSFGKAVFNLFNIMKFHSTAQRILANASTLSILCLTLSCIVVFICRKHMTPMIAVVIALILPTIIPPMTFGYYSVFVLVIAARIMTLNGVKSQAHHFETSTTKSHTSWLWLMTLATSFSLAPLPFVEKFGRNSIPLELFGLVWSSVLFGSLLLLIVKFMSSEKVANLLRHEQN